MSSPEPVTRLPSRAPPGPTPAKQSLLERLTLRLLVDVFGGEAEESTRYLRSLHPNDRTRARERAEERAEAVHKVVLTALACTRAVLVAASSLVATLIILLIASLASGNIELATLRNVGLVGTPLSVILGLATWGLRRWRNSRSGDQDDDDRA